MANIVLVHGIFNSGHIFFWMRRALEKRGHQCFAPNLWPCDGGKGIEHASLQLKQKIDDRFGSSQPISIIGFSMGGVVARYYLQSLNGLKRTQHFFSIATPHHGSYWGYFPYPTLGVRQLRPGSEFLQELEKYEERLTKVKCFSYWTPLDFSIVPSWSSNWHVAENKKFFSILHMTIIFNRHVIAEIIKKLKN